MEAKGPKHERETVILFNEDEATATIWTSSEIVYRRLLKLGYAPIEDRERSATFKMPKREVKLPRPKREMSDEQKESLRIRLLGSKVVQEQGRSST